MNINTWPAELLKTALGYILKPNGKRAASVFTQAFDFCVLSSNKEEAVNWFWASCCLRQQQWAAGLQGRSHMSESWLMDTLKGPAVSAWLDCRSICVCADCKHRYFSLNQALFLYISHVKSVDFDCPDVSLSCNCTALPQQNGIKFFYLCFFVIWPCEPGLRLGGKSYANN